MRLWKEELQEDRTEKYLGRLDMREKIEEEKKSLWASGFFV